MTAMAPRESALVLDCMGVEAIGIVHEAAGDCPVVMVVGGPQYRIGSHRQFVLVARALAAAGHPVLRFDRRGMGDSGGGFFEFDEIGPDLRQAIDAALRHVPGARRVVLWGLCDGAAAILLHAHQDPRVAGIALINPWSRTIEGLAKVQVRHYYGRRVSSAAFWRKLVRGEVALGAGARSLLGTLARALRAGGPGAPSLPDRMADGLRRYGGPVLLILSGNDLTAREFEDAARGPAWRGLLDADRVTLHRLPLADHTFSRAGWRRDVIRWTAAWLDALR